MFVVAVMFGVALLLALGSVVMDRLWPPRQVGFPRTRRRWHR